MSVIATTDTQNYENIADGLRTAGDLDAYQTELSAVKSELAADNAKFEDIDRNLEEINAKLVPIDLNAVDFGIVDFVNDPIIITQGGLDQFNRRITT